MQARAARCFDLNLLTCMRHMLTVPWMLQMLLGAMEQQEVAVAKAGMCASLPARTAVIAAANPAGGSWQPSKTLLENLKLSPALLSRFDLAFVMLDCPDRQHDAHLSEQVLAKHAGAPAACRGVSGWVVTPSCI